MTRQITNDDLWSAIRGLRMYSKTREELAELVKHHTAVEQRWHGGEPMFASQVIAEAARQVLATKPKD